MFRNLLRQLPRLRFSRWRLPTKTFLFDEADMNFHDNYYTTGQMIPDMAARGEYYTAILEFYYDGIEPDFESDFAKIAFAGVQWSLGKARSGRLGGLANGGADGEANAEAQSQAPAQAEPEASPEAGRQADEKAKPKEHGEEGRSEGQSNGELVNSYELKGSSKKQSKKEIPFAEIVRYLNEKAGKTFRSTSDATRQLIRARFDEGYTLDDFKRVIDNKCASWLGEAEWEQYLKPATLFRKTKFEGYLNERPIPKKKKGGGDFGKYAD
ncbi:MAG: conserved phage C-terminal domain-containing protein [Gordonibacter sp.]